MIESTVNQIRAKLLRNDFIPIRCLVWNNDEPPVVRRIEFIILKDNSILYKTEESEIYSHAQILEDRNDGKTKL